jgi:ADP-ribosylglycohydrolase
VLQEAKKSAEATHNHPEAIKGALAVASAIFQVRNGMEKGKIKDYIAYTFGYDLRNARSKELKYKTPRFLIIIMIILVHP